MPSSRSLSQIEQSRNAIYLEALGVGGFYSINYERFIDDNYTLRIGYSSWTVKALTTQSFTGVPIMLNYLYGEKHSAQ